MDTENFATNFSNATKFAMLKLDESFMPEAIAKVCTICGFSPSN